MKGLKNKSLTHMGDIQNQTVVSLLKPSFREILPCWPLKPTRNFTFFLLWALEGIFLFYPPRQTMVFFWGDIFQYEGGHFGPKSK